MRIDDEDLEQHVGKTYQFMVERLYSNGKVNIILSRRAWMELESEKNRAVFFKERQIGDEVEGTVKSFTSFGAFIDLGGFDGLLHINDMSWGHVTSPKEVVQLGQKMSFKLIRLEPEANRINLSLKHFREDPWSTFEEKFQLDDVVKGKVTKLTNFGAFIELEEGIEGLAHISELSWVKRIRHPKEILKVGDEVDVKILAYDVSQGKVSLGFKQVHPNPWSDLDSRFPIGMRIKRKIKNLSNFGAFFELEEGIDGLLHLDDFSWTKKYKHPSELLKEGEEIEIMVIDIDKENQKIKLGLKQLSEDPWKSLKKAFKPGSVIEGTISGKAEFGVFVKVQGGIEGLISNNNLYNPTTENLEEVKSSLKEEEPIKVVVLDVNTSKQKLSLSRKDYFKQMHQKELERYIHDESQEETVTLGDLIKDKTTE
jgi:small subunit ribosomal protein S1